MPPKDDDDPASTKEVVTKKQKQLLNREELDLNLIAESLGGFVINLQEAAKRGPRGSRTGNRPRANPFNRGRSIEKKGNPTVRVGREPSPPPPPPGSTSAYTLKNPSVTPSGGGSYGGLPPNASRQPQVNPKDILNYNLRNRSGVSGTNIPSASGGDAGALARQRLPTKPPVTPANVGSRVLKRVLPGLKQAYAAYRATERGSKGDPLGAAIGGAVALPGLPGNIAAVVDTLRGNPEDRPPAIPRDPNQSDAGTSVATAGLPGFKKDTGKPQPDAYGPGPDFSKSDFEVRQKELEKLKPKKVKLPSYEEDPSRTAPVGAFTVSPVRSASRQKVEAGIAQAIAARQSQSQAQQTQNPTPVKVEPFDPKNPKIPPVKTPPIQSPPVARKPTGPRNKTGRKTSGDGKLPRIGLPGYRGKIGRRSNPQ